MNEIYFSKITDDSLIIREFKNEDKNDLFELFSNPNVCKYLGINVIDEESNILEFIEKRKKEYIDKQIFYLGIEFKKYHKIIGYIGLSRYDLSAKTCQIVYALNENFWHKGLMSKALVLFVKYLLDVAKKDIIIATHIDENINSGRVMEKAGFRRDINYDTVMKIKGINRNLIGYSIKIKKEKQK